MSGNEKDLNLSELVEKGLLKKEVKDTTVYVKENGQIVEKVVKNCDVYQSIGTASIVLR
jgi:hypothetical protein